MSTKAVSNEQIIAALIQHGTVNEAAAAAGTTPRTIYDRMKERDFLAEYAEAKNDIIRSAVFNINRKLSEAIEAVSEVMNDRTVNPAVRLQAANVIISNAGKFADRLRTDERTSREYTEPDPFDELQWNHTTKTQN